MGPLYAPKGKVQGQQVNTLTVTASLGTPWRLATVQGQALAGRITASMDATQTDVQVFVGAVDTPASQVRETGHATARGLPEWRTEVGPLSFQDVRLETVLTWIAGACGGQINVQARGAQRRHYVLRRGPAHQLVREALAAWGSSAGLIELDGGVLYVGAEDASPHATAGIKFRATRGENITSLLLTGAATARIILPLMPELRVGHRGTVDHPLLSGPVRVIDVVHQAGRTNRTVLEVIPL